ncbi:Hypp1932 [Branchiostoma lanceolatum]|uniref:Hypp1932 protein n=1 Tax=Branchiostoma lanceolatum TaxID=7740 RepID=A0A8J9ZM71_BRALA|nr:Hypp1932 [Branchiostoma lanceolatum]
MGTCASVTAGQPPLLADRPKVYQEGAALTAVFMRPSPSQTTTAKKITLEHKDATPQNLRKVFKLDFYPEVLTNKATNVTKIHQGPPGESFGNLEANAEYEVEGEDEDLYSMETTQRPTMTSGDVQRALICCQAVYLSDLPGTDVVRQFFASEGKLHDFVRVSVSRYGPVRYLLAETRNKEEVFVAFKGTSDFTDVMSDLSFWQEGAGQSGDNHNSGVGGKYHTGFMRLAFLVPAHRILENYEKSRIVVCGHSLGGAVAHIVALNMMVYLRSQGQPVDNVTSIAFGAPYFGNDGAQQFAEKHNLSPRMLTIVNEKDPVPYILRLAETVQCTGLTLLQKVRDFSAKARPIALGMLGILSTSGIAGPCAIIAGATVLSQMPAKLDEYGRLLQRWGVSARDLDSLYVPLGWYLCISCSTTKAGGGAVWRRSLLTHPAAIQYAAPDIAAWKEEDFQCHRVSNYRTTFFEIARKTTYRDDDEYSRSSDVTITDAIFPTSIESVCVYMTEGADEEVRKTERRVCQIVIDGDNLDFLVTDKPVAGLSVPGGKFAVLFMSRRKVALQCELQSGIVLEETTVLVRTHFQEVKVSKESVIIKRVAELPFKARDALAVEVRAAGESVLSQVVTAVSGTASSLVGGATKMLGFT